ncbi:c-type cytochrome [Methylosoma difficile]
MNNPAIFIIISIFSASLLVSHNASADNKSIEKKATTCSACHGFQGISNNSQLPNLAGQQAAYLGAQLNAFRTGQRGNPIMKAMANQLNPEEIDGLAAHFAKLELQNTATKTAVGEGQAKAGMCLGCHGAEGKGNGQIPRLASQNADYLIAQLKNFKSGSRKNGQMQGVAGSLSEQDMKEISAYFATLK